MRRRRKRRHARRHGARERHREEHADGGEKENTHHLFQEADLPAGVDFRRQALLEQRGARMPGQLSAALRDSGEDMVPKPAE